MSLDPPTVLLDGTFLAALLETRGANHERARAAYLRLLEEYEADRILLSITSDDLHDVPTAVRRGLLAPVRTLHVARQHRNAARDVSTDVPPDLALAVVLLARYRIHRLATFDARWSAYDVQIETSQLSN